MKDMPELSMVTCLQDSTALGKLAMGWENYLSSLDTKTDGLPRPVPRLW